MSEPTHLPVQKPVSIWQRPIKIKFGELAKALGEGAIAGAFGNWEGISSSGLNVLDAVGLGTHETGAIAWLLVQRSLLQAMSDLLKDYRSELSQEPNFGQLCSQLDEVMSKTDLSLTSDFFQQPKRLPVVVACQLPYQEWLQTCGLSVHAATAIAKRLPNYFVYALNEQWRRNSQDYLALQESLQTPFTVASDREQAWSRYSAWLQRRIDEPMFAEAFSLQQIYVPLRAYYEQRQRPQTQEVGQQSVRGSSVKDGKERVVVDLMSVLEQWVNASDKQDAVRVICGGPGCGKSSFSKMFAAHLIEHHIIPVLLVPLHQFDLGGDLVEAMEDFMQADLDGILPPNPLKRDQAEKQVLIIFDGLDELTMQGKSATQAVQDFVREVLRKLMLFNRNEARVLILMSGREVIVQNNRSEFRQERQVLHILPYYQTQAEREQHSYVDVDNLLVNDLRQQWWQTYGVLKGKGYTSLPAELERDNLVEITAQPLLNYLVALSYDRGELDFSDDSNLNTVYADLLERVYERDWAGYQHPTLGSINQSDFVRILEEIAIACWHGDGRTTTVAKIESRCASGNLKRILSIFQGGAQEGVTRLLTAFYFRQSGTQAGEPTFEFTHKSFGEYLITRRLVLELQLMHQQLSLHRNNPDIGWNEKECLKRWATLCGPTYLGWYLLAFLRDEIKLQPLPEVESWQLMLCELIGYVWQRGMPMEQVEAAPRYLDQLLQALHSEEVLLAALSSCAQVTHKLSQIRTIREEDGVRDRIFGIWLGRLVGQRFDDMTTKVPLDCLNHLDLQGYALHYRDLAGANLSNSDLRGAHLICSLLIKANLTNADLSRANLGEANLKQATLKQSNLSEVNLMMANLSGANLSDANLHGAKLWVANFEEANLSRANLSAADLYNANLVNANCSKAIFDETDFKDANLKGVDFTEANLGKAKNLTDEQLNSANLCRTKLPYGSKLDPNRDYQAFGTNPDENH